MSGLRQGTSETGRHRGLPFARQRARHEQDVLRTGGEPELERSAEPVVRLVICLAGGQVRLAALRTAWRRHRSEGRQARQPAQLARSTDPRRELIAHECGEDGQERRRKKGEDRVLDGARRACSGRRPRRLRELQLLAGRSRAHGQIAETLLDRANLGCRVGPATCPAELLPQLAAPHLDLSPLVASLGREEGVRDGVRDRGRALGVAVAPDDLEDVRVAIHRGLHLVLQRGGGLAGKSSRGEVEDFRGDEERLQRREAPLHRLDVPRPEDAAGVRLHDRSPVAR